MPQKKNISIDAISSIQMFLSELTEISYLLEQQVPESCQDDFEVLISDVPSKIDFMRQYVSTQIMKIELKYQQYKEQPSLPNSELYPKFNTNYNNWTETLSSLKKTKSKTNQAEDTFPL